jgi:WD40 repeat protein
MSYGTLTVAASFLAPGFAGAAALAVMPAHAAEPRAEIVLSTGHAQGITSAVISRGNGRFAATSGDDGVVKLWDVATGRLIRNVARIDPNTKYWRVRALSGDGKRLTVVTGGIVRVLDTLSGSEILTIGEPPDDDGVVMSNDGARVAVSRDGTAVALFDGLTGRELATLQGVVAVSFSQDGRQLIAGRTDKTIDILDATAGARIRSLIPLDGVMTGAAYSNDDRRVVITSASGTVTLWDLAANRQIAERRGGKDASSVFSADGAYWAFADGGDTVEVLNAETGAAAASLKAPATAALAGFSHDNTLLMFTPRAEVNADWALTAVRIATGETANVLNGTGGAGQFGSGAYVKGDDNGRVLFFDVENWRKTHAVAASPQFNAAAFSPGGARIALSRRGEMTVLDTRTGEPAGSCPAPASDLRAVGFSSDGRRLAYGGEDKTVAICDFGKQTVTQTLAGHGDAVTAVSFSRDDRQLISGDSDGTVRIWELAGGKTLRTFRGNGRAANVVAFSPDGRRAFSGTDDNRIHIWNTAAGREEHNLRMLTGPVAAMAVSPDGRRVAGLPYSEFMAKQWNVETGREMRRLMTDVGGRFVMPADASFSTSGDRLLAAVCNNQFVAWDIDSGQKKLDVSIPSQDFKAVAFSDDGRRLITVDEAGLVRHWDRRSGALLVTVFPLDGGAWLRLTPEGFFDASSAAATAGLSVVRGGDAAGIDQVRRQFDRPDLVDEKLAGDPAGRVKEAAAKLNFE